MILKAISDEKPIDFTDRWMYEALARHNITKFNEWLKKGFRVPNVEKALYSLSKKGEIKRLSPGLYTTLTKHTVTKPVQATLDFTPKQNKYAVEGTILEMEMVEGKIQVTFLTTRVAPIY